MGPESKYQRYRRRHRDRLLQERRTKRNDPAVKAKEKTEAQAYYQRNKEAISVRRRENRKSESFKTTYATYRRRYSKRRLEMERKRRAAADKDELRSRSMAWPSKSSEKVREYNQRARSKNPDRSRDAARKWYYRTKIENPEKILINAAVQRQKRRAMKRSAGGSFTIAELQDLYARQGKKCACCKKKISDKKGPTKYHIDHVVPLAKGGSSNISNIALLCPTCNQRKHKKDAHEWANKNGLLFF